ncbi:hypothetical protein D3C87_1115880 [compost metagenome]
MPGTLIGLREVAQLVLGEEVRDRAVDIGKWRAAHLLLITAADAVPVPVPGQTCAQGAVVDLAGQTGAILVGIEVTHVGFHRPGTEGEAVFQADILLAVEVFQLSVVVAHDGVGGEFVVTAGVAELIAGGAFVSLVLRRQTHVFVVGRVPLLELIELAQAHCQVLDVAGNELSTVERLREQATGVGLQRRQVGHQIAHAQFALGQTRLAGHAELGIVIVGTFVAAAIQQASTGTIRT